MSVSVLIAFCAIIICCAENKPSQETVGVYNIPETRDIKIDANLDDWKHKGFSLPLYVDTQGQYNKSDFHADVRIGWNNRGLLLACEIHDDSLTLSQQSILRNDAMELFISEKAGTHHMVQYLMPMDIIDGQISHIVDKNGAQSGGPVKDTKDIEVRSTKHNAGYTLEALIPFSAVAINQGSQPALQIIFHDSDGDAAADHKRFSWHHCYNTYTNNNGVHRIRLVQEKSHKQNKPLHVTASLVDGEYYNFTITGDSIYVGRPISIKVNNIEYLQNILTYANGAVSTFAAISAVNINNRLDKFKIFVDNRHFYTVNAGEVVYTFNNPIASRSARFENDIRLYEYRNAIRPPSDTAILFLGSSTIRLWKSLSDDFPGRDVVLCGFGGSRTADMLYYFDRIIKPFHYGKIVYFCGINDINASVSKHETVLNTKTFIELVDDVDPDCQILLLSNTISVSKRFNAEKIIELNRSYKELAGIYDHVEYVDVSGEMLDNEGKIRSELYSADSTHMNPNGYQLWTTILKEKL